MTQSTLHYLPILTTILSVIFANIIFKRARSKGNAPHLLWWGAGVAFYGLGTFTESWVTLLGWNPVIFKSWYIAGALFGGAPLAQGTIWFLLRQKTAKILTMVFLAYATVASLFVILSPIDYSLVDQHLPNGNVLSWQWVRLFSPIINLYALIFLVGGAILSAYRFAKAFRKTESLIARDRFMGNALIATGALLPGIGGMASRLGETQWLYLGELVGIILIWLGYYLNIRRKDQVKPA
jgi:hypothetical protein